jgi:hypothetical protein
MVSSFEITICNLKLITIADMFSRKIIVPDEGIDTLIREIRGQKVASDFIQINNAIREFVRIFSPFSAAQKDFGLGFQADARP